MWRPIETIPDDGWSYVVLGARRSPAESHAIDIVYFDDGCWQSTLRNVGYNALRPTFAP